VADRFENLDTDAGVGTVAGHGYDESIFVHTPEYRVGRFTCPEASLVYTDLSAGREANYLMSDMCCVIDVTRADGQVFAGTFAGLLVRPLYPGQGYSAIVTGGAFFVERR
jgi:hypothetical protein